MTAHVDLDALVRLAEAATPGPWASEIVGATVIVEGDGGADLIYRRVKDMQAPNDAAHIAAASPDVVLALVERVRAAEGAVGRMKRACRQWGHSPNLVSIGGRDPVCINCGDTPEKAQEGPGASAGVEVGSESTGDLNGPQNAGNEGDA